MPINIHTPPPAPPVTEKRELKVEGLEFKALFIDGKPASFKMQADHSRVSEFQRALNGYLNTRPDAPSWLMEIVDLLDGTPKRVQRPDSEGAK